MLERPAAGAEPTGAVAVAGTLEDKLGVSFPSSAGGAPHPLGDFVSYPIDFK